MNKDIITIDASEHPIEAVKKMFKKGVRRLFVTQNKKIIGVISYTDIAGIDISNKKIKIKDIMTKKPIKIPAEKDIKVAANLMLRSDVSGLLVTKNNKEVGVITKTDICRLVASGKLVPKK